MTLTKGERCFNGHHVRSEFKLKAGPPRSRRMSTRGADFNSMWSFSKFSLSCVFDFLYSIHSGMIVSNVLYSV